MSIGLHVQFPLFFADFNGKWIFPKDFRKMSFMKILPLGAELFHAERRTDKYDAANSRFWKVLQTRLKIRENCL